MKVSERKAKRSTCLIEVIPKLLLLIAILGATGCDAAFLLEAPVQVCKEVATQCQLAKGPLGVCERSVCVEGQEKPCFVCTPQH